MADQTSPPRPALSSPRVQIPPRFLPLSENIMSPRNQTLPSLIHSRTFVASEPSRRWSTVSSDDDGGEDGGHLSLRRTRSIQGSLAGGRRRDSLMSRVPESMLSEQMRSMRLIGKDNSKYRWERYFKSEDELKKMKKPIRQYYERNNFLITQYLYIDRLLDSSLPHSLLEEYNQPPNVPSTIIEEPPTPTHPEPATSSNGDAAATTRVKRTPRTLYKLPEETTPLLASDGTNVIDIGGLDDGDVDGSDPIVSFAIALNFAANTVLLAGKIAVIVLTSSLSVLASLVDAALDFLSTAIVYLTTRLISIDDQYKYPIGRRRLEPIGVLVFAVIMVTSFFQVGLECLQRLLSGGRELVQLGVPAIAIMVGTVVIKGLCWFWCRLVKNSSVQALAQDAMTDVIFNIFSIIFPLVGFYARIWWLDALGGLLLSLYVIFNWSRTSGSHIRNLTGAAASADERNILLYLTMRFAKTIDSIQGLQAYHAGDKLNVEVDVVLDEGMKLKDSHDLGESLQYVLESVPIVDRAFVHLDYKRWNLPTHMEQRET